MRQKTTETKTKAKAETETETQKTKISIVSVVCGAAHCLCLTSDGRLFSFGNNDAGQCGIEQHITDEVKDDAEALIADAKTFCFEFPQLNGNGYFERMNVSLTRVKCGMNHSCVLDANGRVYCFGSNVHGQIAQKVEVNELIEK